MMSVVVDDEAAQRKCDCLLGVQVYGGPPLKIEYRRIRLKRLTSEVVPARGR